MEQGDVPVGNAASTAAASTVAAVAAATTVGEVASAASAHITTPVVHEKQPEVTIPAPSIPADVAAKEIKVTTPVVTPHIASEIVTPTVAPVVEAPKAAVVVEAPKASVVVETPKAAVIVEAPKAAVVEAPKAPATPLAQPDYKQIEADINASLKARIEQIDIKKIVQERVQQKIKELQVEREVKA